jgi:hypothetical protein
MPDKNANRRCVALHSDEEKERRTAEPKGGPEKAVVVLRLHTKRRAL